MGTGFTFYEFKLTNIYIYIIILFNIILVMSSNKMSLELRFTLLIKLYATTTNLLQICLFKTIAQKILVYKCKIFKQIQNQWIS